MEQIIKTSDQINFKRFFVAYLSPVLNGYAKAPVLIALLLFCIPLLVIAKPADNGNSRDLALIILTTQSLSEMQTARSLLKGKGITIRNVFPPSTFIASMPRSLAADIIKLPFVDTVSFETMNSDQYVNREKVQPAVNLWNERLRLPMKDTRPSVKHEPFIDEVMIDPDLPKTREEKQRMEKQYLQQWKQKQSSIDSVLSTAAAPPPANPYGKAYGAGIYDTSLYMAGEIAVGVFFLNGNAGSWPRAERNEVFASTTAALDQFIDDEPNANISFTFVDEGNNLPSNIRTYINELRSTHNTHWAYAIYVYYGSGQASALLWGPSHTLYSQQLLDGYAARHETMHVFGAIDQYSSASRSPVDRWGYLDIVNANSDLNDGLGYFNGAGEGLVDMMLQSGSQVIGAYSRGQVGWRDSDGDGVLNPLDTIPNTNTLQGELIDTNQGGISYSASGTATVQPLINERAGTLYSNVSLNFIDRVEYRLNGGTWQLAEAVDGTFDSGAEEYTFTTDSLVNGSYLVEVRAVNSVGNIESVYERDVIFVTGSSATQQLSTEYTVQSQAAAPTNNTPPEAVFTATPENKQNNFVDFIVTLDASESSDNEDPPGSLRFRWDVESDGLWDTNYSNNPVFTQNYQIPQSHQFEGSYVTWGGYAWNIDVKENYAYVSDFAFLYIIDITNPTNPVLASRYKTPVNSFGDVIIQGNYAYIANSSGLEVVDISNRYAPAFVTSYATPGFARNLQVSGNYAFIAENGNTQVSAGMSIIDISDPANPASVARYETGGSVAYKLALDSTVSRALLSASSGEIHIIDTTNPLNPMIAAIYNVSAGTINQEMKISGDYAYVTIGFDGMDIVNITDPANPVLVANIDTAGYARGIYVAGNHAYIADSLEGMQIFDVSDPSSPTFTGNYDTPGDNYEVVVAGNYAYLTDKSFGLQIADISLPINPPLIASPVTAHWRATLEVLDSDGVTTQATRDMWSVGYNEPPVVNAIQFTPGSPVTATCVGSDPNMGTSWDGLLEYRWDFDNDGTWDTEYTDQPVAFSPTAETIVVCEVRDRFNATARMSSPYPVNNAPTAVINGPYSNFAGLPIAFSSAGSNDPDGDVITFLWDFGDNNTSTVENPSHRYDFAGSYTITLTVSDSLASDTVMTTATVHILDTDSDGLSDPWETTYFGNLAQNATDDPDGDGISNVDEYQSGTNPTGGDVDGDNELTAVDFNLALRHVLGLITLDANQIARGDTYPATGDDLITISDLILLQRNVLGQ